MFFFIFVWINGWVNHRDAGNLRRYRTHHDVIVMTSHKKDNKRVCILLDRRITVRMGVLRGNFIQYKTTHNEDWTMLGACQYVYLTIGKIMNTLSPCNNSFYKTSRNHHEHQPFSNIAFLLFCLYWLFNSDILPQHVGERERYQFQWGSQNTVCGEMHVLRNKSKHFIVTWWTFTNIVANLLYNDVHGTVKHLIYVTPY